MTVAVTATERLLQPEAQQAGLPPRLSDADVEAYAGYETAYAQLLGEGRPVEEVRAVVERLDLTRRSGARQR